MHGKRLYVGLSRTEGCDAVSPTPVRASQILNRKLDYILKMSVSSRKLMPL